MSMVARSTGSLRRPASASATALKARKPRSSVVEGETSRPRTPSTSVGSAARSLSSSALRRFLDQEQQSNVGTAPPVASSLGLVSVPSEVVRQGLLRIASEPNIGRDLPTWADPVSPKNRNNHIGMEERPGPGWDFTNAGLSALRLPTQAAEGHVAEFARNCALQGRSSIRAYEGQRRALPLRQWSEVQNVSRHRENMLRDLHQKNNPDYVQAADRPVPVRNFLPFQEEARCSSPIRAKYCSLHPREQERLRKHAEQRSGFGA
ncbi:Glrx5 [Symbiodinium natans]|uniref:Glrx5 protein n=1 Tax=Symbiodinium natans TaxID=878477 RepID=A0A812NYH9_9DINO|nr:Glrx5 [Symbiodinium natans]